jgi:hypothetical protein
MMKSTALLLAGFAAILALAPAAHATNGDPRSEYPPKRVAENYKNYAVTPQAFYEAAYRALLKRGWKVEVNEQTRLVGNLAHGDELYKVEIRYADDVISVAFVEGFHTEERRWLKLLSKDIKQELAPLKKKSAPPPPPSPVPTPVPSR